MKARVLAIVIAAAGLAAAGCVSPVDENWGWAVEDDRLGQILDPGAPRSTAGPLGMDGPTAERVAERYYRGQEQQNTRQAPPVMLVGSGGGMQ